MRRGPWFYGPRKQVCPTSNSHGRKKRNTHKEMRLLGSMSHRLLSRRFMSSAAPSARVRAIVEEMTLPEISELTEVLRNDFWIKEVPLMVVVMPGTGYGGVKLVLKGAPPPSS